MTWLSAQNSVMQGHILNYLNIYLILCVLPMSVPVSFWLSNNVPQAWNMHISLIGDNQVSVDGVCPVMDWYSCLLLATRTD